MKRIIYFTVLVIFLSMSTGIIQGQGLQITQPNAVGGSFIATHLDGKDGGGISGLGPGLDVFIRYNVSPKVFLSGGLGLRSIMDGTFSKENMSASLLPSFELQAGYNLTDGSKLTPFVHGGLQAFRWGYNTFDGKVYTNVDYVYDAGVFLGGGFQYALNEIWTFQASGDYRYIFTDTMRDPKPKHWVAKAGLTYALQPSQRPATREEIEYPVGEGEISLDDLFREEASDETATDEIDALEQLFQDEQAAGTLQVDEMADASIMDADVGQLMNRIQNLKSDMEERTRRIENLEDKVQANERALAQVTGRGEYAGGSFGIDNTKSFKANYEAALQRFYNKQYGDAIRMFRSLMTSNPDHRLASNCQYWIGESYNALKQYRDAVNAFHAVLNYKTSYKFDDALLMSGIVHLKLGDRTTARDNFQQLVSRYPDSEYAPKAMRYLGRL
jgi:tol-pal system protein YbgF